MKRRKTLGWKRTAAKAESTVDEFQREEILRYYGGTCAYCERDPGREWDHIVPIARGGKDEPGNIVPACQRCNRVKGKLRRQPRRRHPFMGPLR